MRIFEYQRRWEARSRSVFGGIVLSKWRFLPMVFLLCPWGTQPSWAQTAPPGMKRIGSFRSVKRENATQDSVTAAATQQAAFIPVWSYSIVAPRDGNTYTGFIVGRDPTAHGHRTTTIQAYVVPVKITMPDGTVLDPMVKRTCVNDTVLNLVKNSPVFQTSPITVNGIAMGTTQYNDAFQRSNFWSSVQNTPYHLTVGYNQLPEMSMTIPAGKGTTEQGNNGCGNWGAIDDPTFENLLSGLVSSLPSYVNNTTEPIFVFDSIGTYDNGDVSQCCTGGEHVSSYSTDNSGNLTSLQTYIWSVYDTSEAFGGDISDLTHEVAEWTNDPTGNNLTPAWGNIGQVTGCQGNLEVGDPLSASYFPAITMNGTTYDPQELAYFSWFFNQPSTGAGGVYSDNGTFKSGAAACQ